MNPDRDRPAKSVFRAAAAWSWVFVTFGLALGAERPALADLIPFAPVYPVPTSIEGVVATVAADVDGDGDQDLISASEELYVIVWYRNPGGIVAPWPEIVITPFAAVPRSIAVGDMDRDGDLDVLAANEQDSNFFWYENLDGSGLAWQDRFISLGIPCPSSVVAADIDRDGDLDAVGGSSCGAGLFWYVNLGDGTFVLGPGDPIDFQNSLSVFAADIDGDGDLDVLSTLDTGEIFWHENINAGTLWAPHFVDFAGPPTKVLAADLDGDGDADVLSASLNEDTLGWNENLNGAGTFSPRQIFSFFGGSSAFVSDFDGDGDLDVLHTSLSFPSYGWEENVGGVPLQWLHQTLPLLLGGFSQAIVAADLDGDGDQDFAAIPYFGYTIELGENRTIHRSASFPEQRTISTTAYYPWSMFTADVDRDGDVDVGWATSVGNLIAWFPNVDGAGSFGAQRVISTSLLNTSCVFPADIDRDGRIDVVASSAQGQDLVWYRNLDGAGTAWLERLVSESAGAPTRVIAADMNRDGDMDIVSIGSASDYLVYYENLNGTGGTWVAHNVAPGEPGEKDLLAADVDGDGDLDIVSLSLARVAWHENLNGSGGSWSMHVISTSLGEPRSIHAADVDGDGDLDILTASFTTGRKVSWLENVNAQGISWVEHVIGLADFGALMVTAEDIDSDGDLDAVALLYPDQEFVWYENLNGLGLFGSQKLISSAAGQIRMATADVDGDGDQDALSLGADRIYWYPNRGGQFALTTTNVTPPSLPPGVINPVLKIVVTHRGRTGDTSLELATLELKFEQSPGDPLTTAEANSLIETLYLYRDNGDGVFGSGDVGVAVVGTLSLVGGRQTVTFPDGDSNFLVAMGVPQTYFVALEPTTGAPGLIPNDFRVTHLTESSSTAEDVSADIRLSLEFVPNATSGVVGFPPGVISVVPPNNALLVPVGTNVTVEFSEAVNPSTVNSSTFRLLDPLGTPVPAIVGLAPDGRTATLDPIPPGGALAFNAVYTVDVTSGVQDLAGVPAVPFGSRFATALTPPSGIPLASVADQSVLPSPPGLAPGGSSKAASLLASTLGPNLGYSVAPAGDINHDLLADFVGGAPGYSLSGLPEAGAVAIYLGSNAPEPPSGNHPREIADVIFTGAAPHDRAGSSLASDFDFNGDGTNDILIGAEQVNRTVDPPQVTGTGKVYVIYFRPQEYDFDSNGFPDYQERSEVFVPLSLVGTSISGAVLTGVSVGDQAGYAVAAGGLLESSDTRDDVVIGAPGANGGNGRAYVLFSSSAVAGMKSLGEVGATIPGVVYVGSAGERLGSSLALPGDVTAPVGPDIALGAPLADTTQVDAGRVYMAAAGSLVSGTVNASSIPTQVHGDQACEGLGFAIAGGGDNRASGTPQLPGGDQDLLIGSPYFDAVANPGNTCLDTTPVPNSGRVIQTTGRLPNLVIGASQVGTAVDGIIWRGVQAGGGLGWSVGRLGDLSGNHLDVIGLSAPFVNPGVSGAGAVYVVEGSANTGLLGSINADQIGQIVSGGIFLGTQSGEEAGLALCAAGDLDGDGLTGSTTADDFAVGSPGWDSSLGTVHQVLGTLLQQPGECTSLGCTVADLQSGSVLVVPPNAIATGLKYRFNIDTAGSRLPTACGGHSVAGKTLVGSSSYTRIDCATPPCTPPGFAVGPNIEVPTQTSLEYQLPLGDPLALRYCDSTLGWRSLSSGPTTGQVQNNSYISGRKAVKATGVDTLRLYGVFFDDGDHDDVRDTCDCSPGNASVWSAPGPAGDMMLSGQIGTPTTITWALPDCPGGAAGSLLYDTIRSSSRSDFVNGAVCIEGNGTDTTSTDSQNPPLGQAFYYVVSPENGCASGGTCLLPSCVQPPARDC